MFCAYIWERVSQPNGCPYALDKNKVNLKQRCLSLVFVAKTIRMRTKTVRSCFIVIARVFNHSSNDNHAMSFEEDVRIDGADGRVFSRVPRAAWEFVLAFNSPECPCPEH